MFFKIYSKWDWYTLAVTIDESEYIKHILINYKLVKIIIFRLLINLGRSIQSKQKK